MNRLLATVALLGLSACASAVRVTDASIDRSSPPDALDVQPSRDAVAIDTVAPNDATTDAPFTEGYPCGPLLCGPNEVCVTQLVEDGDGGWTPCEHDCWPAPPPDPAGWSCADFNGYCRLACLSVQDRTVNCVCD